MLIAINNISYFDLYTVIVVCKNNPPTPRSKTTNKIACALLPVQSLFPGLWLTEITADAYRVPDE